MTNSTQTLTPEAFKAALLGMETQYPKLASSLENLRKEVEGTLYGHLMEPHLWMKMAVGLEYPEIAAQGADIAACFTVEFIAGMEKQAGYYLEYLPKYCNSYPMVQEFHELVTKYIKEHSGQFIRQAPPITNERIDRARRNFG